MTPTLPGTRGARLWLAVAVLAALVLGALCAPWPVRLDGWTTGDAALAAEVRKLAAGQSRIGLAVAVLEDGELRQAGLGDTGTDAAVRPDTRFEIGSVTKMLTASLFADLVADGVVEPDDTVREVLPDRNWPKGGVGDATLAELASHRSGLPKVPLSAGTYFDGIGLNFLGLNPYADTTPADVLGTAATADRPTVGKYAYSNLGFALLGHVLAEKTGVRYPDLLRQRVLGQVGMDATAVPDGMSDVRGDVATGHDDTGRRMQPWLSSGDAPAGAGVWSDVGDLATFADQVMRGKAPGASAAEPRYRADGSQRIGYAWVTSSKKGGGKIVWHNGAAGGCMSFVGFDRETGRVVVVLSNTYVPVDDLGVRLLTGAGETGSSPNLLGTAVGLLLPPAAWLALLGAGLGGLRRKKRKAPNRARILAAGGEAVLMFAIALAVGSATVLNLAGWLAGAALCGTGAYLAVTRWRELPWTEPKRPALQWTGAVVSLTAGAAVATAMALTT
ncbi:MAG: serine hydrolase [Streptosporangiales bacterium]|nr:serine hydrolase [Streptosporangiales bacterium]